MRYKVDIEMDRGGRTVDRRSFDSHAQRFVKIGTMPTADIKLHEPRASRLHAMIEMSAHGVEVRDLGSIIGTKVNELSITSEPITDGDQIRIGDTVLRVCVQNAVEIQALPAQPAPGWRPDNVLPSTPGFPGTQIFPNATHFQPVGQQPFTIAAAATQPHSEAGESEENDNWPPRQALRAVDLPAVGKEKYDTGWIVTQMRRSRRRSGAGAVVAVSVTLGALGFLGVLTVLSGDDAAPPLRAAAPASPEHALQADTTLAGPPAPPLTHTVARGDTLSGIAKHYLGDTKLAPLILDANRDVLTDPSKIEVGMTLRIPRPEGE